MGAFHNRLRHVASLLGLIAFLVFAGCDREASRAGVEEGILGAFTDALNARDVEAVASLYHDDYESVQPPYPDQTYQGKEQVRASWSRFFSTLPDFRAQLLRSSIHENEVWSEWEWSGTDAQGNRHLYRGVIIFGIREGRIRWSRMYMEPVGGESGSPGG